jgi:hypothetical protein
MLTDGLSSLNLNKNTGIRAAAAGKNPARPLTRRRQAYDTGSF